VSALNAVSLLLDLMPVPMPTLLFGKFGDISGYRQFHQVGIVNPTNQKGIEEIKRDYCLIPCFSSAGINH
jgi:hypothetical protein